ncbi:MAG: hypothetical protein AAFZ18_07760 [Myxococcota bacterium]
MVSPPDESLHLEGRILVLTDDGDAYQRQLQGEDLPLDEGLPKLRYGINTDLIINGAACTLGYTPEILGPHFLASYEDTPVVNGMPAKTRFSWKILWRLSAITSWMPAPWCAVTATSRDRREPPEDLPRKPGLRGHAVHDRPPRPGPTPRR